MRGVVVAILIALAATRAASAADPLSLELIMGDPEWMGRFPESPRWSEHGLTVLFDRKMPGCEERELVELDLLTGAESLVPDEELPFVRPWSGAESQDGRLHAYVQSGDVFVSEAATGRARRLTLTPEAESAPEFLADGRRLQYRRGDTLVVHDLESGLATEPVDARAEAEPSERKAEGFLRQHELALFDELRDEARRADDARQRDRERAHADPSRPRRTFWLGKDRKARELRLSPDGRHVLAIVAGKESDDWARGLMPTWVNESAQVETRPVRAKVGAGDFETERLLLLDLDTGAQRELDLGVLPGIEDDPLASRRKAAEARAEARRTDTERAERKDEPRPSKRKRRPVGILSVAWSDSGAQALVMLRARDNKDRWIARLAPAEGRLVPLHRLHDDAWVGWDFNDMGFVPRTETAWWLSEESGFSHLQVHDGRGRRALTSGRHVVEEVAFTRDGRLAYFVANEGNPGVHEVHRVEVATGRREQVTRLGGRNAFALSPDERRLLLTHSESTRPPELLVQDAEPGAPARTLTDSRSDTFRSIAWQAPRLVDVPSTRGAGAIHARLWTPEGKSEGRPAVLFLHGAGYLQDAHEGWSGYFRESLLATLLARRGYVVMSPDYRASAGYGRDWRTAIHLRMGHPEVEDLEDVVSYLAARHGVDRSRVGAWGGSYGGFLVLMTMFREPALLACGAALRPVTDWAHYNHPYTSNILETPELAPEAYRLSSPITHAHGLARPLLICAPMLDDNVFFQDSVRLVQRLIELGKEDWEIAIYPVEPHTFRDPASWLDEYRRIVKLFETHLNP